MQRCACRVAPSLGALEGDPNKAWGTIPYDPKKHRDTPTVFFGLYDLRDYIALFRHRGKKWVLWAGSDLRNIRSGFMLNDGKLKWASLILRKFPKYYEHWSRRMAALLHEASHFVENEWEAEELGLLDIECRVVPSFMGNVDDYEISYQQADRPKVYLSSGKGREEEYGWGLVEKIADKCQVDFYLYGSDKWESKQPNVHVMGRVPKWDMNRNIKEMQCGLRLNESDGFSEITAKSVLWGQWPISRLRMPHTNQFKDEGELIYLLNTLCTMFEPNVEGRKFYREILNSYPWVTK